MVIVLSGHHTIAMEIPLFDELIGNNQWDKELEEQNDLVFSIPNKTKKRTTGWSKKRRKSDKTISAEELKKEVIALCAEHECLLCKKEKLKQQAGFCFECSRIYSGKAEPVDKYRLFMHWVETHHPVGQYIYQYSSKNNMCNFGCNRTLNDKRTLSFHIIAKHVCEWVRIDHMENCKNCDK